MYGHVGVYKTLTDVPLHYITLLKVMIGIFRQTDFPRKQLDDIINRRATLSTDKSAEIKYCYCKPDILNNDCIHHETLHTTNTKVSLFNLCYN